jgi:RNA polymerase sigma-70 factor (ECF subfamily)
MGEQRPGADTIAADSQVEPRNVVVTVTGVLTRMEACIPALRRYATSLLRNREEADDLVHDCLVRALDKLHTRRDDADVRAWLFAIMHNLFISQLRRKKSRPASEPLDEMHESAMSLRPEQESNLQFRDLVAALNRLPVEQRSVVLLVTVEDLSYAEAASVLGIPVGTVMSRLARGRERLRQMTEEGEARPVLRRVK